MDKSFRVTGDIFKEWVGSPFMASSVSDRTFNLLKEQWLPVRRKSGAYEMIRPAQLVDRLEEDPIISFAWTRADFQIASMEFCIGLLASAFPPTDNEEWCDIWAEPPTVEQLDKAFRRIEEAFWLDGDGSRFLQDFKKEDFAELKNEPIERLLIESPGDSTVKKNTDLFIHRERINNMGLPAAAMALFTLQSWAPSGGQGNRVGIRGGGPLLTLISPFEDASLWEMIWANVPTGKPAQEADFKRIFPWLALTIESKGNKSVICGQNAHPLQCWWGMPRRIRLNFRESEQKENCDVMGYEAFKVVDGWKQRPYGVLYKDWTGGDYDADISIHPLTPRYRSKENEPYLSIHPQKERIGYRHWVGVAIAEGDDKKSRLPASVVVLWKGRAAAVLKKNKQTLRLLAAGYIMDNMKACNFIESYMPFFIASEPEKQKEADDFARSMINAAKLAVSELRRHIKNGLLGEKSKVSFDSSLLSDVQDQFWIQTESAFYACLEEKVKSVSRDEEKSLEWKWFKEIGDKAKKIFDDYVALTAETNITKAQQIAKARKFLSASLSETAKGGDKIRKSLGLLVKSSKEGEKGHE